MGVKLGLEAASEPALHLFMQLVPWDATEQERSEIIGSGWVQFYCIQTLSKFDV